MAYHYNPDGVPYVPTHDEYRDNRERKVRDEVIEMLKGRFKGDKGLIRHLATIDGVIDTYERRAMESKQSEASGHLPTTGEPLAQVANEPSIPRRQPDRVERPSWLTSSTWALDTTSYSGGIMRPSAQTIIKAHYAAHLWAGAMLLFPYPLNNRSRFFPTPCLDQHDDQHVSITEENPSEARSSTELPVTERDGISPGDQGGPARAIGPSISSNGTTVVPDEPVLGPKRRRRRRRRKITVKLPPASNTE
ncbi:hypothetical protein F4782DRAFT_491164 [Xylaria castorea]|nr:hypothetical protein F4782DRAFT_491164 [Xylaria castorea]